MDRESSKIEAVESFRLDHTKIADKVPYVRLAMNKKIDGDGGLSIKKFDLRLCRPNSPVERMKIEVAHTLEHILAVELRPLFGDAYIDLSPMGCLTGFYLTVVDKDDRITEERVCDKLSTALQRVSSYSLVPGAAVEECGSFTLHDLNGAIRVARINFARLKAFGNT